jgi:putative salt-induced outer membrane protein YdiY
MSRTQFVSFLFLISLLFNVSALAQTPEVAAVDASTKLAPTFKNDSELGVVITGGNSQTSTSNLKQANSYEWSKNVVKFSGNFLDASNKGTQQAYQWGLGVRYERDLTAKFAVFAGETLESDKYQNIEQRYSTDIGGKYLIEKTSDFTWNSELGYRFARENYPYGFKNINFIRLYSEAEKFWTKTFSTQLWAEYLPNITQWEGYQFNTELSASAVITSIFSLKTGYQLRYYNAPPIGVAYKTDTVFTTALVAKF